MPPTGAAHVVEAAVWIFELRFLHLSDQNESRLGDLSSANIDSGTVPSSAALALAQK